MSDTPELHYLIELGPTQTGTIIRTETMTAEAAAKINAKVMVIKFVSVVNLEAERTKARLAYQARPRRGR